MRRGPCPEKSFLEKTASKVLVLSFNCSSYVYNLNEFMQNTKIRFIFSIASESCRAGNHKTRLGTHFPSFAERY